MRRRSVSVLASSLFAVASFGATANAAPPIGRCPDAFEGPLTFTQIVEEFPPPPGLPDPIPSFEPVDLNDDSRLCVRQHANGVAIIVIDNAVRAT